MGGRGTFAAGKNVDYLYEINKGFDFAPDGIIDGIKIIKGIEDGVNNPKHDLPASSHSSNAYIKYNQDGTFNALRLYDDNHALYLEIAYHVDNQLGQGKILHYHTYDDRFSKTVGNYTRSEGHIITKDSDLYKKYSHLFRGVKL